MTLKNALLRLVKGSPEAQAVKAGEIDAVIDYAGSNVIVLPAARRALREAAKREGAKEALIANGLLAALPRAEYQGLLDGLEPLTLRSQEVLLEPGAPIRYVYFPIDCVISLLTRVEGNQALEVGLVGHEGMAGVSLALGAGVSSVRAVVLAAGTAMRMEASRFRTEFRQCPSLQRGLYRYAHANLALARQTIACNYFHAVEARLARWLLMTSDCTRSREFFVTQAILAKMLGVRRATVNEAARPLQQRKLIGYCRGQVRILDRKSLEAVSCWCYAGYRGLHYSA